MLDQHVKHSQILAFAVDKVNLPSDLAKKYRSQVDNLREQLEKYIAEHPDYSLVKMLHAGSVAKGTALRTIDDMDVAVYVKPAEKDIDENRLLLWLKDRLQEAYPQLKPEQFSLPPGAHCVTISFIGEEDGVGYLIPKDMGVRVMTSIPLHLDFIRKRKKENPDHFAQVVRLVKWWKKQIRDRDSSFRFKSFMIELICAYLADTKQIELDDYPKALGNFFAYIVNSGLKEPIIFTDNYSPTALQKNCLDPIRIFDPVNPENNVASKYTEAERQRIVEEAKKALNAISAAMTTSTKGRAQELWRVIFGPTFFISL
jgi:tRNA nucleotidyltransferase (CCA-adding enzyme)